jgi:hypothetical protein
MLNRRGNELIGSRLTSIWINGYLVDKFVALASEHESMMMATLSGANFDNNPLASAVDRAAGHIEFGHSFLDATDNYSADALRVKFSSWINDTYQLLRSVERGGVWRPYTLKVEQMQTDPLVTAFAGVEWLYDMVLSTLGDILFFYGWPE